MTTGIKEYRFSRNTAGDNRDDDKRRVLIVDDDRDFSAAIGEILDSEGYEVRLAHDARQACDMASGFRADVALLDIRLGQDSGIDLIGRLSAIRSGIICVMMTGHAALDTAIQALEQGAYHYLRKPIDGLDLLASLDRCFEKITLERQKNEAVEANSRLAAAVEHAAEAIMITDREGKIQYVNPAFEHLNGFSSAEALGNTPRILRSDTMDPAFYRHLWNTISRGSVWKGRFINKTQSGQLVHQEATISCIRNAQNDIVSYVSVARDVSREVELEAQLRQAQKLEAIGTLAGGIAHDFNNMLSPILGYAELALSELEPGSELWDNLNEIHKAGERASTLVSQILTFSRRSEQERSLVNLESIVTECMQLVRSSLPATITISLNLKPCPAVLADPTQMHQVVMNLCTNAYHAMRENGGVLSIDLGVTSRRHTPPHGGEDAEVADYVQLAVTDTGSGMDRLTLERIFEPYFTTKEAGQGTGLGLATVHGIIHSHDGEIDVESSPGQGTTVRVYLPISAATAQPESTGSAAADSCHGQEHIMVIDDEPAIVTMLSYGLKSLGYQISGFTDSVKALETFSMDPDRFDAVITDQTMPELTGTALANAVLALRPGLPIILITGFSDTVNDQIALELGIGAFLYKPASPRAIATALRDLLDKTGA